MGVYYWIRGSYSEYCVGWWDTYGWDHCEGIEVSLVMMLALRYSALDPLPRVRSGKGTPAPRVDLVEHNSLNVICPW